MALPRELGLQVRMVVAIVLSAALLLAAIGACVAALFVPDGWSLVIWPVGFVVAGFAAARKEPWRSWRAREPTRADRDRVRTALDRLALNAGAPAPALAIEPSRAALSWTTALPRRDPRVHVTTALLDRLGDRELQAVLAHELAHVLHRDALLVTLLAGPPAYLLGGLRAFADDGGRAFLSAVMFGAFLGPPAALMLLIARIVSRHRELAADRTAAVLTGSPESVAAALLALDEGLRATPKLDLRKAASRDDFHFLPARRRHAILRPWGTHPPTADRVERLERMARSAARTG